MYGWTLRPHLLGKLEGVDSKAEEST